MKDKRNAGRIKKMLIFLGAALYLSVFGGMETKAETKYQMDIPEDEWLEEMESALELQYYTAYTYDETGRETGDYRYNTEGELFYYKEVLKYENKDNCVFKRVMERRADKLFHNVYFYTYQYMEDKTACFMDKYKNGKLDYSQSFLWDVNGKELLSVDYDENTEIDAIDGSFYDEEGRLAYSISGLADLDTISKEEMEIYSYKYDSNGVMRGYTKTSENGKETPCYRKEEIEGAVLLESSFTSELMDKFKWYAYDEEGRKEIEISISEAWNSEFYEISLEHYIYDESGLCEGKYTYDVVDDIIVADTGKYSDVLRYFAASFEGNAFPYVITSDSYLTGVTYVTFDYATGKLAYTNMGE
ncbi:MAG: hypothetical protein IJF07_03690 [Lachnospiraceae bacterium]|nr:hypothetical protein [Lachnospiraceae bacterium]